MKQLYVFLILYLLFSLQYAVAQRIVKVEGSAQVRMEPNMTENDTRKLVEELAKIDALQSAFGTIANQEFNMMIEDGKQPDYNIIAKTEVAGEWVETTDRYFIEDFKTEKTQEGDRNIKWITCNIKGKARKLPPRALIDFYPLNCTEMSCMTTEFVDGAGLYLSFKSPVDGYLSVFLDDGNEISRLLPDSKTSNEYVSGVSIAGDQDYIFFSPDHNLLPQEEVDEYVMFTSEKVEFNYLYIVFSEQPFVKPILKSKEREGNITFPKKLTSEEFQKWESENKYKDFTFQVKRIAISIRAK